jgi:flagellar biogenesis protein FliO
MKDFIKGIFSSGTPESSKRLFGALGFICAIIFIAIWKRDLVETLLIVSASLLGLETLTNIFKKNG